MSEQPHKKSASSAIRVVLGESSLEIGSADGAALVGNFPTVEQTMHEIRTLLEADESIKTVLLVKSLSPLKSEYLLTPHERRILKLFVEGSRFQVTAQVLVVSINTVSFHVRHIYEKLEVHSKSEAVVKAIRNNLV